MLPFLVILAAAGCVYFARRHHWAVGLLTGLLVLHAVSSLHVYPNYLSYANEAWGGPGNLYKYLPGSDAGQAYWQVRRYMELHPGTPCWLDSNYLMPSSPYEVPCTQMGNTYAELVPTRMNGIVFVSASALQADGQPGGALAPFYGVEAKDRLGGSAMLVYEGEFDTRAAAARALDRRANLFLRIGRKEEAMDLARQALYLTPDSANSHYWYGVSLAFNDQPQQGLSECSYARGLFLADGRNQRMAKQALEQMQIIAKHFGLPLLSGVQ
jgi:tetratricopeptide (TPR) repeat protein